MALLLMIVWCRAIVHRMAMHATYRVQGGVTGDAVAFRQRR
jgi:hypothetical protein